MGQTLPHCVHLDQYIQELKLVCKINLTSWTCVEPQRDELTLLDLIELLDGLVSLLLQPPALMLETHTHRQCCFNLPGEAADFIC